MNKCCNFCIDNIDGVQINNIPMNDDNAAILIEYWNPLTGYLKMYTANGAATRNTNGPSDNIVAILALTDPDDGVFSW